MSGVEVRSSTQRIIVEPLDPQTINARPNANVSVINAGPMGPASNIPGPQGPQGPQGEPGAPGPASGTYTHNQIEPDDTWVVTHNLGFYPAVTVIDSAGSQVEGDVEFNSLNQVTLSFSGAFSGIASFS